MWSLLQHIEYFKLLLLQHSQHVPRLRGHCGDMFAIEPVPHRRLYAAPGTDWPGMFTARIDRWHWPNWFMRAKLTIGALEFASEIYKHDGEDSDSVTLHMCHVTEHSFGYTNDYDLRVMNIDDIRSQHEVVAAVAGRQCVTDADCAFSLDCAVRCDGEMRTCSGDVIRPTIRRICGVVSPFLMRGIPRRVRASVAILLDRCRRLNSTSLDLEHSLIVNEFTSLLWRYISHVVN